VLLVARSGSGKIASTSIRSGHDAFGVAISVEALRALSDEELVRRHDSEMKSYAHGGDFYLQEIWRREVRRSSESAEHVATAVASMTRTLVVLTWVILALTAINVVAAFVR
jgi:hypothetical protein